MKSVVFQAIFILLDLALFTVGSAAQVAEFRNIKWAREKIAPGLVWKTSHTMVNDSVPQNFNILIVNTRKRTISILYDPKRNIPVSKQASGNDAIAAVNAGFFNMQSSGSVTYTRVDGKILDRDTAIIWNKKLNMTGSVMITDDGKVMIGAARLNNWYDSHPEYRDVLVTGPLLLLEKQDAIIPSTPLALDRHPRTAIGTRGKQKVILITADGRSSQAKGMTLDELTDLMRSLKCVNAVNLDGGGSTTMWISGKPYNGVVNMPSDNRKFDHAGERAVADIITVK